MANSRPNFFEEDLCSLGRALLLHDEDFLIADRVMVLAHDLILGSTLKKAIKRPVGLD